MRVAIDPGSRATGVVVFHQGDVVAETFYPRMRKVNDHRKEMVDRMLAWLVEREQEAGATITAVVVEAFVKFVPIKMASRLKKTFEFKGYVEGRLQGFCDSRGAVMSEICKGSTPKSEATMLARAYNFSAATQHEIDAFHLGVLAGFYPRLS